MNNIRICQSTFE